MNGPAHPRIEAVSESEALFRAMLDTLEEAYYEVDLAGNIVRCNAAFYRMVGYTESELVGRNNQQFQTPEGASATYRMFNQVYKTGVPLTRCDVAFLHKDGRTVLVEGSIHLTHDDQGRPNGFRGFQRDVTAQRRTETALRESEAKYRGILETIEDAYYEVDLAGVMVLCNGAFCRMLGYASDDIIGRSYRTFQMPEAAASVYTTFNTVFRTGIGRRSFDWTMIRRNGEPVTGEGSVQLVRDLNGRACGFRGILRDVTERRRVEQALRESEARFRALTKLSSDWYWEQDADFRYTRMEGRQDNRGGEDGLRAGFVGKRPWETALEIENEDGWDGHRALLASRRPFRDVVMHRLLGDGRPYYISVSGEPFFTADGSFAGYRGVSRDITDRKLAEERIHHLATHDALTGLPNRSMFSQLLGAALEHARPAGSRFAVLFVDLDRFKHINDTLGHDAGDRLLKKVTERFRVALRSSDVMARLGGDEFVILVRDLASTRHAGTVARKILAAAVEPVMLNGRECRVSASIGIAIYPRDGSDEQTLMKNADIAMYYAKEEGKNNFQFYTEEIKSLSLERLTLENHLRRALERGELSLHYQPKLHLASSAVAGVEALLRWNNAELGPIPPNVFIPIAEETGLIIEIGKWVLREACEQNIAWQRAGLPPLSIAVNLSVRQFGDERLLADIAAILRDTGMSPQLLELEITEGMMINNPAHAARLLGGIRQLGVRLAIDDFGTGYSSLGQLKNYPIDTLKIDRSFIRDIAVSAQDRAITEAIIAMGKSLGLSVVAEGVETPEQERFLRERGCDEMQGFHFAHPMPGAQLEAFLRSA
ncbi:MAG TPA: EAL domain-containing protein [Noviherbaspirillum sp.]|nr:EAL domain-containing protein [Noviherbaspirillum sp.]